VLVKAATKGSGVAVDWAKGKLVGVGKIVPVGVGKTGWKGVGVGPGAGWNGVEVGLAFGLAVTNVNGKDCAAGVDPQALLRKTITNMENREVALR
jgi:hypothetical protein